MKRFAITFGAIVVAASIAGYALKSSRRLAPDGTFYLVQGVSIPTTFGVTGLPAGTIVQMIQDKGATMLVSFGQTQILVPTAILTNDMDLGELAGKHDAESQQALMKYLEDQRAEYVAAQEKQNGLFDQQQKDAYARHVAAAVAGQHHSALNRGAYAAQSGVSYSPFIYYSNPYFWNSSAPAVNHTSALQRLSRSAWRLQSPTPTPAP